MQPETPQKEHHWLQKFVGEWTTETQVPGENGQPPTTLRGSETVRRLGDLWVMGEGRGEMPGGGTANMVITLGYDPKKQKYVGTWVGSMMTVLWVYEGAVDPAGTTLTLDTEGPDFANGGKTTAKYREVIEFKTDDHRVFSSHVQGADGKWNRIMQMDYRRKT
jgi:hypothetical protein